MARVTIKFEGQALGRIARSEPLAQTLEGIAQPVLAQAQNDPNEYYVSTLRMRRFYSSGRRGRVAIQIGAAPQIGSRVEAIRGTLARALGLIG